MELVVSIAVMLAVVVPLAAWAVRADRRRRAEAASKGGETCL
jgi:hypothetical protein